MKFAGKAESLKTAFISGFFVNDAIIFNALERHLTLVLIMRNRDRRNKKPRRWRVGAWRSGFLFRRLSRALSSRGPHI